MIIYPSGTQVFNNEGLGILSDYIEPPIATETNSGSFELRFAYADNGYLAEHISEGSVVKAHVNQTEMLPFVIYEVERDEVNHIIYVTAELKHLWDMKRAMVKSGALSNSSVYSCLSVLFNSCDPKLTLRLSGSTSTKGSIEWEDSSVYDVVYNEVIHLGGEIKFTEPGVIVKDRRGADKVIEIRSEDYVKELKVKHNKSEQVTRIIPYTTIRKDFITTSEGRNQRDSREEKVYGTPVVSPKVASDGYPIVTKFVEYSNESLENKDVKTFTDENNRQYEIELTRYKFESVTDLNNVASEFFAENKGIDEPSLTVTLDTMGLYENVHGNIVNLSNYDTVIVYTTDYPEGIELMVVESEFDESLMRTVKLKFDSQATNISEANKKINRGTPGNATLSQRINSEIQIHQLQNFLYNNRGERLEFGNTLPDPKNYHTGDKFWLENGDNAGIYQLINGAWEFQVGIATPAIINQHFEEIEERATTLQKEVDQAKTKADQANDRWEEAKETIKLLGDESKFTLAILGEGDGFQYPDNKLQIVGQDPVVDTSKMFKVTPEKGYETLKLAGEVEDVTAPARFDVSKFVFVERPYSQVVIEVTES